MSNRGDNTLNEDIIRITIVDVHVHGVVER